MPVIVNCREVPFRDGFRAAAAGITLRFVNPWQRLVGTRAEPRRVANPGIVFLALVLALGWFLLGVSALTDGRTVQGMVGLGLAVIFPAWTTSIRRKRRDTRG